MARRMLINALHPEECRIAVAEDDKLLELEIERSDLDQLKGNIYKAEITRIEPSLQAAFLDIGSKRNGFLQINDVNAAYFQSWPVNEETGEPIRRPSIKDVLSANQNLIVQVVKDERDAKGATLTTNISIPGRYLVLMVGNQRGGVSRKISDSSQRSHLKEAMRELKIPPGMGVIIRTAGINRAIDELQRDLDGLLNIWGEIVEKSMQPQTPHALYEESKLAIRTIRDFVSGDIDEILIDEWETYLTAKEFVEKTMPQLANQVVFYDKPRPLFSNFHLDAQVDATSLPEVQLPSGGSIVINQTEAIVAIDVNSGRATGQADVEDTAFETNKEAAITIAEQLRLRDMGGLVVIDFIDMLDRRHKQVVEKTVREAVRTDKAKVEVGRISKFGLLELSRQRLKASLVSQNYIVCPDCLGRGRVKSPDTTALEVLRKIQSAVHAGGVKEVRVRMAPTPCLFLLNNKRQILSKLEEATDTRILIFADGRIKPDQYQLELDSRKVITPESVSTSESGGRKSVSSRPSRSRSDSSRPRKGGNRPRRRRGGGRKSSDKSRTNNRSPRSDTDSREKSSDSSAPKNIPPPERPPGTNQ